MCNNCEYVITCPVSGLHNRKSPSKQCAIDILEHLKAHQQYLTQAAPVNYGDRRDWGWD